MILEQKDYRHVLKGVLAQRIAKNPSYSLRAFSNQLGIHHSMLVQVFQNKKRLSVPRAHQIAARLELKGKEYEYFCLLVELEAAKSAEQKAVLLERMRISFPQSEVKDLSVEHFQMISEWYHLPILQMVGVNAFKFTPDQVAKRLGITKIEAEMAIERLERLELIEKKEDGSYQKRSSRILTQSKTPQEALQKYHQQMLQKAIESIVSQTPEEKWIGSETFAFDTELLKEARETIETFYEKMVHLAAKSKNKNHIYHLNTCLYRLTNLNKGDSK